jgi:hypothetical protein
VLELSVLDITQHERVSVASLLFQVPHEAVARTRRQKVACPPASASSWHVMSALAKTPPVRARGALTEQVEIEHHALREEDR